MLVSYIDKIINKSKFLSIAFVIVVIFLSISGIASWFSISKLFNKIERYEGAAEVLLTVDRARLYELAYARDLSEHDAKKTKLYIDRAISLLERKDIFFDKNYETVDDLNSLLNKYKSSFTEYEFLIKKILNERKNIISQGNEIQDDLLKLITFFSNESELLNKKLGEINTNTTNISKQYLRAEDLKKKTGKLSLYFNRNKELKPNNKQDINIVIENAYKISLDIINSSNNKKINNLGNELILLFSTLRKITDVKTNSNAEAIENIIDNIDRISLELSRELKSMFNVQQNKFNLLNSKAKDNNISLDYISNVYAMTRDLFVLERDLFFNGKVKSNKRIKSNLSEIKIKLDKITIADCPDKIKALNNVKNSFILYRNAIKNIINILIRMENVSNVMNSSSVEIDEKIVLIRKSRYKEVENAKSFADFISLGEFFFIFSIISFAFFIKKSGSELRALTSELKTTSLKAMQATKEKSQFLAMMSHEVRNPMNAIIGMSYLALEGDLKDRERSYIKKIYDSGNLLLGILNDILDFSKIEAGKLNIEYVDFSLEDVINKVEQATSDKANEKGLNYEVLIGGSDMNTELIGDPLKLYQILLNLVSNAIKFTSSGRVALFAESNSFNNDSVRLNISVNDEGIGMNREQLSNLYTAFNQADRSTTREYGGTGLGLHITKRLIDLMGGNISVDSEVGKGTTFKVALVLKKSSNSSHLEKISDDIYHDEKQYSYRRDYNFTGSKILVVEDNKINQEIVVEMLENVGAKTTLTSNGAESLEVLKKDESFDLILMDYQMPIMDGYEATKKIRLDLHIKHIPIIALTANVLSSEREKMLSLGMNDIIKKPIIVDDFYHTINNWIKKSQCKRKIIYIDSHDGICLKEVLRNLSNNESLYLKLIEDFYNEYKHFKFTIDIDKKNIHEIKGASGNLGFIRLYEKINTYEKLGEFNLEVLNSELNCIIKHIQNVNDSSTCTFSLPINFQEFVESLKNHAESNDFETINILESDQGKVFLNKLDVQTKNSILDSISKYDFDLLVKILNRLSFGD